MPPPRPAPNSSGGSKPGRSSIGRIFAVLLVHGSPVLSDAVLQRLPWPLRRKRKWFDTPAVHHEAPDGVDRSVIYFYPVAGGLLQILFFPFLFLRIMWLSSLCASVRVCVRVRIGDMVSRRRILSRSRDDLNLDATFTTQQEEEEDVWYNKDKLYK
ncbi:hypothetical protein FOCC_FOCC002691, partial [Frankliniella occidentalis]